MRPLLAVLGGTALGVGLLAAPAAAAQERMQLDCGGDIGVIERTNGASWWGVDDGAVHTTKQVRVQDAYGVFETHISSASSRRESLCGPLEAAVVTSKCMAPPPVQGWASRATGR